MIHRISMLSLVVVFVAGSPAGAQLPLAPPPHPTLDSLVKEYLRLGLPLPPKEAELVRLKRTDRAEGQPDRQWFRIGFRTPPKARFGYPELLVGVQTARRGDVFFEEEILPCDPRKPVEVLNDAWIPISDLIPLAVQCELRGWHDLSRALYRKFLFEELDPDDRWQALEHVQWEAWGYWANRLFERGTDRREAYRHLKSVGHLQTEGVDIARPELVRHLKLTLAPRTSKPGTNASLIDDLTEDWVSHHPEDLDEIGKPAFNALVSLGFDAVPDLIEHFDDERYTRALGEMDSPAFLDYSPVLVGTVARKILSGLAGKRLQDKKEAAEWWEKAKKVGEAKWLSDHISFKAGKAELNGIALQVIATKHSEKLPDLYRRILRLPSYPLRSAIRAVVLSKLGRAEKLALLKEGMKKDPDDTLLGMLRIDPEVFHQHLVALLRDRPMSIDKWVIVSANSGQSWAEFLRYVQSKDAAGKQRWIRDIADSRPWSGDEDPARAHRIRFLLKFLDDRDQPAADAPDAVIEPAGDTAAFGLAGLLTPPGDRGIRSIVSGEATPGFFKQLLFRTVVAGLATEELRRIGKKP